MAELAPRRPSNHEKLTRRLGPLHWRVTRRPFVDVKWSQIIDVTAGDLASVYASKAKPGVLFRVSGGTLKGTFEPTKSGEPGKPIGVTGLTVDGSGRSIAIDGSAAGGGGGATQSPPPNPRTSRGTSRTISRIVAA